MRSPVGFARLCCILAIGGAALAVPVVPAAASADGMPVAVLRLTAYSGPDDNGRELGEATLICEPTGGNHPSAADACTALKAVEGDLAKLPVRDGICIKTSQPTTAVAEGWYNGPVQFRKTYDNPCVLRNALAPVFDFLPARVTGAASRAGG